MSRSKFNSAKQQIKAYTEESIANALIEIEENKISINRASILYKVPYSTLNDIYNGLFKA